MQDIGVIHDFLIDSYNEKKPTKFSSTCYIECLIAYF